MSSPIFERFLSTPEMLEAFGAKAFVQAMLDFEAALARAEAAEGSIPEAAATAIAAACRADRFDLDALAAEGARAGSLAIPLVRRLTEAVRAADPAASNWVHWGSTSQDVIDSAMACCTRRALGLLDATLGALELAVIELAGRHLETPALARTLMQPAQVVSFGFKLVAWAAPLDRSRARLHRAAAEALNLQFGGAVGTLSTLGAAGPGVARRMAADLGLGLPPGAWHAQRDAWVALGCEVGVLCGTLGKIGTDIALLAQGEIGEVAEPSGAGRGGSSAMPHKRNPVAAMVARAAALRAPQHVAALLAAMGQEQERGLGNWQAELAEWPGLWASAHGAASALAEALAGLEVDAARMRANIESLHGLVFAEALAVHWSGPLGKPEAQRLVETLSRRAGAGGGTLHDLAIAAIEAEPALHGAASANAIAALFDIDAAARLAGALARPRIAALRTTHAAARNLAATNPVNPP